MMDKMFKNFFRYRTLHQLNAKEAKIPLTPFLIFYGYLTLFI